MVPRKGIHILLDAWSRILPAAENADLLLVGPRPTDGEAYAEYQQRLDRAVSKLIRPESVRFVGPVDNVEEYLRAADIFVFPSEREGMPNVVPEAMATGLACLVAPFDGLPEEFGSGGRDYELTDREGPAMAGLLLGLIKEPHRRAELGSSGRAWVEQNLALGVSIDRYAQLYRSLAANEIQRTQGE
jgi:glycosyltransferase involved in cell wall biosynthesis